MSKSKYFEPETKHKMNFAPLLIGLAVVAGALVLLVKTTWVGELLTRGPEPADPMAKLTSCDARKIIQEKLQQGLAQAGAKGKFSWTLAGAPADISNPSPIQLNVQTRLTNPKLHEQIIAPVKDYMDKAQLSTLTLTDSGSRATWTYTVGVTPSPAQPGCD